MPPRATTLGAPLLAGLLLLGAPPLARPEADAPAPELRRYREAHDALAAAEYARAQAAFESFPAEFLLADYAAFYAAEALVRAGAEAEAAGRFQDVADRFPDSVLVPAALLAAADIAFRLARWPEAESLFRRFLSHAPVHPEADRALVRLAELPAAQGRVAAAIADLRRRWVEVPASPWGRAAREIAEDLARRNGLRLEPLTDEERLLVAQRLADANELTEALQALAELLAQKPDAALWHRALARLAPAFGRLRRSAEGIGLLQAAAAEPATPWQPALLYELARLHRRAGQTEQAMGVLERLLAVHPSASVAPAAWLALARARRDLEEPEARATLEALVRAFPESAAGADAAWEVAWLDYRGGRYGDAAAAFRRLAGTASVYRVAALYWAGRAQDAAGDTAAAAALYREVAARVPEGYYGILARPRLGGPPPPPLTPPVDLPRDPLAALATEPRVQKGRALLALGFDTDGIAELERLGHDWPADSARAWSLAAVFADVGETGRSLRYLRRAYGSAAEGGAPGLPDRFWRLLYPFGYADLVRPAAARAGLDPLFVAAVIREESSYDPRARSGVGAIGLMQLMPETARTVAGGAGVSLEGRGAIWEPGVNIALGAHYLGQLQARFPDMRLVAAGYNAGPGRVERWLRERRIADLEEFVDLIPFDETRAFVKRVYTSWHHYGQLYGAPDRPPARGEAEATPRAGR